MQAQFSKALSWIIGVLVVLEALFSMFFVLALIVESGPLYWAIVIGGLVYTLAIVATSWVLAGLKKVHIAFPIAASVVGLNNLSLIFVLVILGM